MVWYPLSERAPAGGFYDELRAAGLPSLAAELTVDPDAAGIRGCGIAVINPPWRFDAEARSILDYLGPVLDRGHGAQGSVRWVVAK